jgi:hypothetical protein
MVIPCVNSGKNQLQAYAKAKKLEGNRCSKEMPTRKLSMHLSL